MQRHPDGRDERERRECRNHRRERHQDQEQRSGEAAAAEAPLDADPDRRVREQVESAPTAEREGPDRVELLAGVRDARSRSPRIEKKSKYASQNDVATRSPRIAAATSRTPMSIPVAPRPIEMNASPSAMISTGP